MAVVPMLIRVAPPSSRGDFTDYLLRLGCTVTWLDENTVEVFVTHPETVEDEASALEEWCRTWVGSSRAPGRALELDPRRELDVPRQDRRHVAARLALPGARGPVFDL